MSAATDRSPVDDLVFGPITLRELVDQASVDDLASASARLSGLGVAIGPPARRATAEAGAAFHETTVEHDGRPIAQVLVGPYKSDDAAAEAQAEHVAAHAAMSLELLLHAGHKLLLATRLHEAAMRDHERRAKAATIEMSEARARLGDLERLKASFLSTVSHELRTPLTSIIGYSEMLAEGIGGSLSDEQHDFVQTVRAKSVQLLDLIVNLLDLSKLESGAAQLRPTELNLNDVLGDVAPNLAAAAVKKGVTLRTQPSERPPIIRGDRERMAQIVRHLAENGIAFTPAGGEVDLVVRTVSAVGASEIGGALTAPVMRAAQISVSDTGAGIAKSDWSKIFDPFFQIDQSSTREHGGVGLGLALVKRIVEAHGGTIHVEANEPRGTSFIATIPMPAQR